MRKCLSFFDISHIQINGYKNIEIGENVYIAPYAWISATNGEVVIENSTLIGRFAHIYSTNKIHIKRNVLIAERVYISDNQHTYSDVDIPIMSQPVKQCKPVIIKDGAWIGENVCIIGATVGRNSVIGANSVVIHDIPDYCVAVGTPARIIKRYCFTSSEWKKTDSNGEFID